MRNLTLIVTLAALGTATAAQASLKIDARQANQQRQIDAGKRSGKLSLSERNLLTSEQRQIKRVEDRLSRSGGRLTDAEERQLDTMLDRSQAHIVRLKHNHRRGPNGIHIG